MSEVSDFLSKLKASLEDLSHLSSTLYYKLKAMRRERLIEAWRVFEHRSPEVEVIEVTPSRVRVRSRNYTRLMSRQVTPSTVYDVYTCPRRLYLKLKRYKQLGYEEYSLDVVRLLLRGIYLHTAFTHRHAWSLNIDVPKEVLESYNNVIGVPLAGIPDGIATVAGRRVVVELKSTKYGIRYALVQGTLYAVLLADLEGRSIDDYLVVAASIRPPMVEVVEAVSMLEEARRAAGRILEIVNSVEANTPPPVLSGEARRLCDRCELRTACQVEMVGGVFVGSRGVQSKLTRWISR